MIVSALPRPELYVETSVINGPFSLDLRIALASSVFWDKVKVGDLGAHISSYVLYEIEKTPDRAKRDKLLDTATLCVSDAPSGPDVKRLAKEYVKEGMIPREYIFDAYHIASASLGKLEALVTWNFEHILKERTEKLLEKINMDRGLHIPRLKSPEAYLW